MDIKSAEFRKGIRGTDPILYEKRLQIAFIGRSNVGKSSLINCLVKSNNLVKSGKTPGKTQEINFFIINNAFYFVDLPGYGYAKMNMSLGAKLAKMIEWYFMEKVFDRKAVLIIDSKIGPTLLDFEMLRILEANNQTVIIVANKVDSLNQSERSLQVKNIVSKLKGADIIFCSAKTKEGRAEILQKIFQ